MLEHEAGTDEAMLEQSGDPDAVLDVAFTARDLKAIWAALARTQVKAFRRFRRKEPRLDLAQPAFRLLTPELLSIGIKTLREHFKLPVPAAGEYAGQALGAG